MLELVKGAREMVEACTDVKRGDDVVIIAENEGRTMWMGEILAAALESLGARAVSITAPPAPIAGTEPPRPVAAAMKSSHAIFCISDKGGFTHTDARKEASAAGARYYMLHQFDVEDWRREMPVKDIRLIRDRTETICQMLEKTDRVKITSPAGTHLVLSVKGRKALPLHPMAPVAHLHDYGEAAVAPVEGTAEGTIVVDVSLLGWDYLFRTPLRYTVKGGEVVEVSGDRQEVERLQKIRAVDENAGNIGELGIGTSHIIHGPIRGRRIDAARLGTAHIAIGRNNDMGGKTWSAIHLDGLMDRVTIELDGRCILKDGVLQE